MQSSTILEKRTETVDAVDPARLDWIREQLARITKYKPGWTFTLDVDRFQEPAIIFSFPTEDAYNPGQFFRPESIYPISWCQVSDPVVFAQWLLAATMLVEMHECAELLEIDGQRVFGPHDDVNRDWSLEMYDQVNKAAMAGQNPLLTVLYAAARPAIESGTVRPEPIVTAENRNCINALARNIPLRAFAA